MRNSIILKLGIPFILYKNIKKEFNRFPKNEGCYILTTVYNRKRKVRYIGHTKNLRRRMLGSWQIRLLTKKLRRNERIDVLFFPIYYYDARWLEVLLIRYYKPTHNVMGSKSVFEKRSLDNFIEFNVNCLKKKDGNLKKRVLNYFKKL